LDRISTLGTKEETGTGLGLIVCKTMARMINGDLSFTSEERCGSTFTLTLPLAEKAVKQQS
jgi:signal transduction histidine kinase